MDEKQKKYLKIFRAEADEHLAAINRGLLLLEKGSPSPETIHEILRASHTLKGSARMLGLEEIGSVAHKMEDVMKAVEEGKLKPGPELVDRMLEAADTIAKLLREESPEPGPEEVQSRLSRLLETAGPQKEKTPERKPEKPPRKKTPKKKEELETREPAPVSPESTEKAEEPSPPPPQKPRETEGEKPRASVMSSGLRAAADTLRVPAERLDRMIDFAGELLITKSKLEGRTYQAKEVLERLSQLLSGFDQMTENGRREQAKQALQEIRNLHHEFLQEFVEDVLELDSAVQEIQHSSLNLRMTPASTLFDEFPRLVRDLAREMNKKVKLVIQGEDTELDKRLLEQLKGPLVHIIRNACDHGIESPEQRRSQGKPEEGTIVLRAFHHGSSVIIEVSDDGAGMDPEKIRKTAIKRGLITEEAAASLSEQELYYLTLQPGFSTSDIITDISGRGVGLDVVKTNVEALRGDLTLRSERGKGLTVELKVPLTVSIIEALLVAQSGDIYAIPLTAVEEVARVRVADLVMERGREAVPIRGRLVPLVRLGDLLGLDSAGGQSPLLKSEEDMLTLVVLRFRDQQLALEVDAALREQEILVKSLGKNLARAPLVSGATVLRKGEPALILNIFDIFNEAIRIQGTVSIKEMVKRGERERRTPHILVVDDSITTRTIEKNILERAGYKVSVAVHAEEALEKISRAEPGFDLFVVDVDMPGMNGFELTAKLRENPKTSDRPVIIVTSRASDEDKRKGIQVGAQAYIVKGAFDQNVLLNTVKSLIGD